MKERIFVCVASYRDNQLEKTIISLLENAEHPELIDVWILNQLNFKEDKDCLISEVEKYPQISQSLIDYKDAKWCSWARSVVYKKFFKNQDFVLQVDSHCRFAKNWDTELKNMWKGLNDKKWVISHYPSHFDPKNEILKGDYFIKFKIEWFNDNSWFQRQKSISSYEIPENPVKTAFIAWWFIFGPWKMIKEVPYDPYIYFNWEEEVYAARLWTSWYNMYAPNKILIWHYYNVKKDNNEKHLHWKEHNDWSERQELTFSRCAYILDIKDVFDFYALIEVDKYWLWKERTLEEYEKFSWVFFRKQIIKDYAKNGEVNEDYKIK